MYSHVKIVSLWLVLVFHGSPCRKHIVRSDEDHFDVKHTTPSYKVHVGGSIPSVQSSGEIERPWFCSRSWHADLQFRQHRQLFDFNNLMLDLHDKYSKKGVLPALDKLSPPD
eukprot:761830-Amphidinium_carterae.1